jgi:hypothetical protein
MTGQMRMKAAAVTTAAAIAIGATVSLTAGAGATATAKAAEASAIASHALNTSASPTGATSYAAERGEARYEYREVTIPAGTVLPLRLTSSVASDTSGLEDPVHAQLRRTITVRGIGALPAGSAVSGYVTEADRSAKVKGRARVGFRFNTVSARGESYRVSTSSVVRQAPGTKKKDAAKIAIPAAAGAIIGGIADGKKGAAIGTAVGGGAGTGVVLATRGQEVRLGRGAIVSVRLLKPLTVLVPR